VRGKGITGVEQAARVTRAFRKSAPLRATLVEVAEEMDDYLADFFDDDEFATALLVDVSDPGVLRLVSAGHPAPQLVRESEARVLDLPIGRVLGLDLQAADSYAETTVPWSTGDRLLVCTDGLSEARDSDGEFFPVESMDAAVRLGSVERAVEEVVAAVRSYVPRGREAGRPGGRGAGGAGGKLTALRAAVSGPARPTPPRPTRPPAPPGPRMPAGRFRS
jgi:sigma-B regulation protein RsbU (phosphoserine phosphatase)